MTRIRFWIAVVVIAGVASVEAWSYLAYEQVVVNTTPIGFTASKITSNTGGGSTQATQALCRLETAQIRYTIDGTTPAPGTQNGGGTLLEVGDYLVVSGADAMLKFRAIRTVSQTTAGFLDCTYTAP